MQLDCHADTSPIQQQPLGDNMSNQQHEDDSQLLHQIAIGGDGNGTDNTTTQHTVAATPDVNSTRGACLCLRSVSI